MNFLNNIYYQFYRKYTKPYIDESATLMNSKTIENFTQLHINSMNTSRPLEIVKNPVEH